MASSITVTETESPEAEEYQNLISETAGDSAGGGGGGSSFQSYSESFTNDPRYRIVEQKQGKPKYRILSVCHFAFKLLALLIYIFCGFIGLSYISTFVLVLILLSVDFWIVKNLSGRLLAGLRWWNVVNDDGKMVWRFEAWSAEERLIANRFQVQLFWICLITQQVLWSLFGLVSVFTLSFKYGLLCLVALSMNGANLLGYLRCKFQSNQNTSGPGFFTRMQENMAYYFSRKYTRGSQT